jgi:regulator of protease activity HflC (stomatin/prohibitin superfamily)
MAIGFIIGIVVFVLMIGAAIGSYYAFDNDKRGLGGVCIALCVAMLLTFIVVPFSFHTVESGQVAVVKQLGKVNDEERTAGTHFDIWVTNNYIKYDATVQTVDLVFSAYSADAQTMDVTATLQYQIIPDKASDIAIQYGVLATLQNRITSIAVEKAKSELSKDKAMDIIANRAQMSPRVEESIKNAIGEHYYVNVVAVVLTDITFTDAFELAVEEKMIAEQAKLKAEYENQTKVAQAEAEAEAKLKAAQAEIDIAQAQAEARLKQAQAEIDIAKANAQAKLESTAAEAEALRIKSLDVARMLGFIIATDANGNEYIDFDKSTQDPAAINEYLKYLEYMATWDGKLPDVVTGDDISMILPGN